MSHFPETPPPAQAGAFAPASVDYLKALWQKKSETLFEVGKDKKSSLKVDVTEAGASAEAYMNWLDKEFIPHTVQLTHPAFMGHMTSLLPSFHAAIAAKLAMLHQNTVKIESSGAFTLLERHCLEKLHRLFFKKSEKFYAEHQSLDSGALGLVNSGGTVSNLSALWLARSRFIRDFGSHPQAGLSESLQNSGYKGLRVFCSERGHYSLRRAANLLGLGDRGLCAVEVDENHQIKLSLLKQKIEESRKEGYYPLALVGVAGSTETGSFDPLKKMAKIAKEEKLYFHVDAAWGGAAIFSPNLKTLLAGCELADSVTIDGHKQLYTPMGLGLLLFADPKDLSLLAQCSNYVLREDSPDLGKSSIEGSRPASILYLHAVLSLLGEKALGELVEKNTQRTHFFAELINEHPHFQCTSPTCLNILTFRYNPWKGKLLSAAQHKSLDFLNEELHHRLKERGRIFFSRTRLRLGAPDGALSSVFRCVLANPRLKRSDFSLALKELENLSLPDLI